MTIIASARLTNLFGTLNGPAGSKNPFPTPRLSSNTTIEISFLIVGFCKPSSITIGELSSCLFSNTIFDFLSPTCTVNPARLSIVASSPISPVFLFFLYPRITIGTPKRPAICRTTGVFPTPPASTFPTQIILRFDLIGLSFLK